MDSAVDAGIATWAALLAFLAVMIVVDLKVGSAQKHMTVRTAAVWSAIWIALSLLFGAGLWAFGSSEAGEAFYAGYAMEKALSLDNVFVFTLIFAALAVPRDEQPRVLLYGILIALVLRAAFIFAGAERDRQTDPDGAPDRRGSDGHVLLRRADLEVDEDHGCEEREQCCPREGSDVDSWFHG